VPQDVGAQRLGVGSDNRGHDAQAFQSGLDTFVQPCPGPVKRACGESFRSARATANQAANRRFGGYDGRMVARRGGLSDLSAQLSR
jgi:hypothetical protein